jgi:hypothetical protein
MEKLRYEVDPHNRLAVKGTGKGNLPRFRRVLDGWFKLDGDNNLLYHIKAPLTKGIKAPYQVKLRGTWSLTQNHDLRFTLDKWRRQTFGDQLTIQGDIIDVNKNSLLFAVSTQSKDGSKSNYLLQLGGSWQADKNNRLTFMVKRGENSPNLLTLEGVWEIGENNQIVYRYQKEKQVRRIKKTHTLVFQGHWDIKDKARISYVIDKDSDSGFDFRSSLGIFQDKCIKYEVGVGVKPIKRTTILFGSWKIRKNVGLVFEAEYNNKKIHPIVLGAEARLTDKDTVSFNLKDNINKGMGAQFELSHKILKGDGQAFLKLLKSRREQAILVGAGWGW